jgi:hypothetical protein
MMNTVRIYVFDFVRCLGVKDEKRKSKANRESLASTVGKSPVKYHLTRSSTRV